MFRLLSENFNRSSKLIKFELYVLSFLLIVLLINFNKNEKSSPKQIKLPNSFNQNFYDLNKDLEKLSKNYKIKFSKITYKDKFLSLTFISSLKKIQNFLYELEYLNPFSSIEKIYLKKNGKNRYEVSLYISFEKFYFKNKRVKKIKTSKNSFVLKAIIGEEVLINSTWLKLEDSIDGFILKRIKKREVLLRKGKKDLRLRMSYGK